MAAARKRAANAVEARFIALRESVPLLYHVINKDAASPVYVSLGSSRGNGRPFGDHQPCRVNMHINELRRVACSRRRVVGALKDSIAEALALGKTMVWIPVFISDSVCHANSIWVDMRGPKHEIFWFEPHGCDFSDARHGVARNYYDSKAFEALQRELVAEAWEGVDYAFYPPSTFLPPVWGQSWHPSGSDELCKAWAIGFLLGATLCGGPREWVAQLPPSPNAGAGVVNATYAAIVARSATTLALTAALALARK